jgi:hypothetical protein
VSSGNNGRSCPRAGVESTSTSLFGDWTLAKRLTAVKQLETAALDPDAVLAGFGIIPSWKVLSSADGLGKYREQLDTALDNPKVVSAFENLKSEVTTFDRGLSGKSWKIGPDDLKDNLVASLNAFRPEYPKIIDVETIGHFGDMIRILDDRFDYHDYLRDPLVQRIQNDYHPVWRSYSHSRRDGAAVQDPTTPRLLYQLQ